MAKIQAFLSRRDSQSSLAKSKTAALLIMLVILGACSSNPPTQSAAELPTVAQLPTLTATPDAVSASPTAAVTDAKATGAATETATVVSTSTPTPTVTPSTTITDTPTPTWTATEPPTATDAPTADNEGIVALAQLALQATVLPPVLTQAVSVAPTTANGIIVIPPAPVSASCPVAPPGGFGTAFQNNPALIQEIGCPVGTTISMPSAAEGFEHGQMIWFQGPPATIYVLQSTGRFQRYDDTNNSATDPVSGGETPPQGLKEPVHGFGKVWRTFPDVRNGLGWAVNDETGGQATVQIFDRGQMAYFPEQSMIYVLAYDPGGLTGTWQAIPGSF